MEAVTAEGPNMDEFYQQVVSSDEEDFVDSDNGLITDLDRDMSDEEDCCDSDVGSVADLEWDTWADACSFAYWNAVGAFPPEAADIRPAVVFRDRLFSGEELADTVISVRGDVPMSPVQQLTDMGVAMIPPVAGRPVQRTVNGSVGWDVRMKKVGCSVGQSCFRMNSEDTLPVLQDAYDDCGDDRFSPGISDRMSSSCHVDLDSLWMVHWEDRRTVVTGSRAGVSDWRSVLCGIARMSCLPVFPANHDLECLNYLGRNCIMDFSAGGTLSPSKSDLTVPNGPYVTGGPVSRPRRDAAPGYACWPCWPVGSATGGTVLRIGDTGGPWRDVAVIRPRRDAAPGYTC